MRDQFSKGSISGEIMLKKFLIFALIAAFLGSEWTPAFAAREEKVIWAVKPKEGNYMKYFGKRIVDVNRAEADRLIPQELGWQGNQLIFIFRLSSGELQQSEYQFSFEITSKDYNVEEMVEMDVYSGTNLNNLKTVAQGVKIERMGTYSFTIPSTNFYLGSQNFIRIFGRNVRPIGYGENPPNCRFGLFKLSVPAVPVKPTP